jgi:hypothetical protein
LLRKSGGADRARNIDIALYGLALLLVGGIGNLVFLRILQYYMQPWYFLVLMLVVAVGADMLIASAITNTRLRVVRLVLACIFCLAMAKPTFALVSERRTNVDVVAASVATAAEKGDLIIVAPWYYGVSFNRYYTGQVPWTTIPAFPFIRYQRYDLLHQYMMNPQDITKTVEQQVIDTLKDGKRVWWVGDLHPLRPGEGLPPLWPAPSGPPGWSDGYYLMAWMMRPFQQLQLHAKNAQLLNLDTGRPVSRYERLPVAEFSGYQP